MAEFNELFPDQAQPPFVPIEAGRVSPRVAAIRDRARMAISVYGGADSSGTEDGDAPFGAPPQAQAETPDVEWADYGKAAVSGLIGLGQSVAGAGRTVANKFGREEMAGAFNEMATDAGEASQAWIDRMTPQSQERLARKWATLDPTNSIWRGSARETLGSLALQATRTLPSTIAPLGAGGFLIRVGARMTGRIVLGASEATLSMGDTSNAIRQEVMDSPDDVLQQDSQRYAQLRQGGMEETAAKEQLAKEAEGMTPQFAGALVGVIGFGMGRYIEPVFRKEGMGLAQRIGRGAVFEGVMQEGPQNAAQQIAQNVAAQTFDQGRSLMQGVGEQTMQGVGLGGVLGGGTAAIMGRGPQRQQAIPSSPVEPEATPEVPTQGMDDAFGPQTPPTGGYTGAGPELPDIDSTGQRLMGGLGGNSAWVNGIDPALQVALNARADGKIDDMFEQLGASPQQQQQAYLQNPYPATQQGMELSQPPLQQTLPLRGPRVWGGPPESITPMSGPQFQTDLSAPPESSMERLPGSELVPEPNVPRSGKNRASALRERARAQQVNQLAEQESARAGRYAGTVRDENQIDAFADPESPASGQDQAALQDQLKDAFDLTQDSRIAEMLQAASAPGLNRGQIAALYKAFAQVAGIDFTPGGARGRPERPSAEPLGDLKAQLDDLADPDSGRSAVYLSRDNMAVLRKQGTFEQIRGIGVPVPNFDLRGGTLIAKNRAEADRLIAERKAGREMQEILGRATGAGYGKLMAADIAVQQRDEQGNVVRESLVASPEEAESLASQFDAPGREGVILSAGMAIKRRAQRVREEGRQAQAQQEAKQVRRSASDIIETEFGADSDLASRTKKKIGKNTLSENEAARRLVGYSARLRKRELKKRLGEVDSPDVLEFDDLKTASQYKELFGHYRDSEIAERMATTSENTMRARARRESFRRQIGALRTLKKATSESERVARVARKISTEEVEKIEREVQATAKRRPADGATVDTTARARLEKITPEQLREADDSEVNILFAEAANISSGSRASVGAKEPRLFRGDTSQPSALTRELRRKPKKSGTVSRFPADPEQHAREQRQQMNPAYKASRHAAEAGAITTLSPHGRTLEEIIAAHPTKSERIKFIERVQNTLERRKHGGKSRTHSITAAGGERKTTSGTVAIARGKLNPMPAFEIAPPREISIEEREKHNTRAREAYHELGETVGNIKQSMFRVLGPEMARVARAREGVEGNPPLHSRRAVYARAYLRNLLRYGQLLERLHPRSRGGLKEIEEFNRRMKKLLSAPKNKFFDTLSNALDAEIGVQAQRTAAVDPKNLGALNSRKRRILTAKIYNAKVEDQLKWTQRLHEKWHTNSLFNENVAPLMQKIIGYVTRDSEIWNYSSERRGLGQAPTLEEMQKLQFALKRFRGSKTARENLLKPLKRFFEEFGFKFDGPDLIVPKNAEGKFEYSNEAELLRKFRDNTGYRHAESPEERASNEARRRAVAQHTQDENTELARRGRLTPRQRATEDRAAARKAEQARRQPMTYEQRKALEALDRRDRLKLELLDLQADLPSMRKSAEAVAAVLESDNAGKLNTLLKLASSHMSADNPYQAIIQRLIALNMDDAIVGWDRDGSQVKDAYGTFGTKTLASGQRVREIILSRAKFEVARIQGNDPSPMFIHALVHEATHAASAGAIRNNPRVRAAMWAIMRHARTAAIQQKISLVSGEREFYGFRDNSVDEFVTEAFSNPVFQAKLREIKIEERSVWQVILDLVKRLLGMESMPHADNVLDAVLSTTDKILTGEMQHSSRGSELTRTLNLDAEQVRDSIANTYDKMMQSSRVTQSVHRKAVDILAGNREGGTRALLSALTMEQIGQFYNRAFGGSGPLSQYLKAFFERNADNAANMEDADRLSRRWTRLTEKLTPEKMVELSRVMTESTLYGIHPDEAVSSPHNSTVTSLPQKNRHAELAKRFAALDPEIREMYSEVRAYYDRTLRAETALVTINALRGALTKGENAPMTEREFKTTVKDIEGKKLNTVAGLEAEFGDALTQTMRTAIARIAAVPASRVGPYFPLMRFGDYVVTAEKVRESKYFDDKKDAREWANSQKEDDPTLSVSSPIEDGEGGWHVKVSEKEVRMAESPSEAEQNRQEMLAQYGDGNVSQVQLKAQLYTRGATIASSAALDTILGKLKENPAAQAAIKDFYLRSLADSSFRKREIRRANRRGVDYDQQHRTFASYAKASAYFTAQLKYGWQLADGLIKMQKYTEAVANGKEQSSISPVRMAEVVREIDTRDKLSTNPIEVSKLVRNGTALSQFMMLTSPSYWLINATQPWMVTLPWLAARSSVGEASAALGRAQKLIASPILSQMGESWLGAKALTSKAAAERAFTVLEQVEEYIKARAGAQAPEYINMLHKLKRESIIDLSFVAELRDIAEGANAGMTQKVLDASRIMAHLTEVNNRIMTAIAAFDLYRSKGMSIEAAEGFAKQAVSLTQFNYSAANTPRLFSARGPLGQAGPLVFQFMKYPQHIYALLIDNMRRAVSGGQIDKAIARKTLLGLFSTHLAAGGLTGVMLQPIKWAIGFVLMAFGDDDEPYTFKNAVSGETYEREMRKITSELFGNYAGEILAAGVPRAGGIDVSNRMSLGSLYYINFKTDTAESTLGSIMSSFGGPLVSLSTGFWRGGQYIQQGQLSKGFEAFMPKGMKDIFKAVRYTRDGLTDGTGKQIMDPQKLSPSELFAQSLGFAPADVSEQYAHNAAIKDKKSYDETRRAALMQRFNNASPEERSAIVQEVIEFNRGNPGARITRSQLLRSARSFKQREQRVKRYGADLSQRERIYEAEGAPYEDEE